MHYFFISIYLFVFTYFNIYLEEFVKKKKIQVCFLKQTYKRG